MFRAQGQENILPQLMTVGKSYPNMWPFQPGLSHLTIDSVFIPMNEDIIIFSPHIFSSSPDCAALRSDTDMEHFWGWRRLPGGSCLALVSAVAASSGLLLGLSWALLAVRLCWVLPSWLSSIPASPLPHHLRIAPRGTLGEFPAHLRVELTQVMGEGSGCDLSAVKYGFVSAKRLKLLPSKSSGRKCPVAKFHFGVQYENMCNPLQ